MKLQDVAVSPDSIHLLGVGPLLESPTGLQPSKSRAEKRLAGIYNGILLRIIPLSCISVQYGNRANGEVSGLLRDVAPRPYVNLAV